MALLLNIDTSGDAASVCLSENSKELLLEINDKQRDHAAWLHPTIEKIIERSGFHISNLDAISVTIGPGSYTGLRVGLATAKGICYALNKPLITLNTLIVMAYAAKNEKADLLCPMIDARRMEVFTALYNQKLEIVKAPTALVLDIKYLSDLLSSKTICFFGNGSEKFRGMLNHKNAIFSPVIYSAASMIDLAEELFITNQFADIAYSEPLYLKEFYTPPAN